MKRLHPIKFQWDSCVRVLVITVADLVKWQQPLAKQR